MRANAPTASAPGADPHANMRVMSSAKSANFERSRRGVNLALIVTASLIIAYWIAWWSDRTLVASRRTASYYSFEEGFQLADAWLLATVLAATVQLSRRRPSAVLWLVAAGGAGLYLLGMDMFYDFGHATYGSGSGGVIELVIDILLAAASIGVLWWSWHYRSELLDDTAPGRRRPRA